jgi:hypothetical protein
MVSVCQSGMKEYVPRDVLRTVPAEVRMDDEWTPVQAAFLRALLPYPEARAAVLRAIEELSAKVEDST